MTTFFRRGDPLDLFDVIRIPFPFSDLTSAKTRPALVISPQPAFNAASGHVLTAMITSAALSSFPLDVVLENPFAAGLLKPCVVRMKLFTASQDKILEKCGRLQEKDRQNVTAALKELIPLFNG